MNIIQSISYKLNGFPVIKKGVKRIYQYANCFLYPPKRSEGKLERMTPEDDGFEYFFGYYDKSPWDASGRYMLCLRVKDARHDVSPRDVAEIILIDTEKEEDDTARYRTVGTSRTWNVQQGCMLQWLGPKFDSEIIYNDYRGGKFVSVIHDVWNGRERVINMPVYSVSTDGTIALSLDFSRLYNLRPGYGYFNVKEETEGIGLPDATAIWKIDLSTCQHVSILKYKDFASFCPRNEMRSSNAVHKVNHIMISPNGKRFMVIYRWFNGMKKHSRLITSDIDGRNMCLLLDEDMVSHCCWKDDEHILAFAAHNRNRGYFLIKDQSKEIEIQWPEIEVDGHPSYSPDGSRVVTDTYADKRRMCSLNIIDNKSVRTAARVFEPFEYDNETRCDLHPRWNRTGDKVCFDGVFEGRRKLYVLSVPDDGTMNTHGNEISLNNPLLSVIVPVYNTRKYLQRCVNSILTQSYSNVEIILVDDGSTDGSSLLCDKMALSHDKIKVIHKTNGGLGSARNVGIAQSNGELITFVDSDDWISADAYKMAIQHMIEQDCDIADYKVAFAYKNHVNWRDLKAIDREGYTVVVSEEVLYDYLYRAQMERTPFSVCRKIYSRKLFDYIRFPEGKLNEDIVTNFRLLKKCNRLIHIPVIGYYYYQENGASITKGALCKKDFDLLFSCKELAYLANDCMDLRIKEMIEIKTARSYFSLLSKAAVGGVGADISREDIKYLTMMLRKNTNLLLSSKIPLSRKIIIIAVSIDYRIIAVFYKLYKLLSFNK